jgi:hypothetical protein
VRPAWATQQFPGQSWQRRKDPVSPYHHPQKKEREEGRGEEEKKEKRRLHGHRNQHRKTFDKIQHSFIKLLEK